MTEKRAFENAGITVETYTAPELVVHGTVGELTRGQGGPVPDSASGGSFQF